MSTDYCHVDAAAMFFLTQPERFDVVVTDNLFGDILTDIGAAIAGGIGLAASGNIDPSRTNPSMFEPVHGSAPDIAGQGKADPTATVLSVAMLLAHLGHQEAADRVEAAVAADLAARGTPFARPARSATPWRRARPAEAVPAQRRLVTRVIARVTPSSRPAWRTGASLAARSPTTASGVTRTRARRRCTPDRISAAARSGG